MKPFSHLTKAAMAKIVSAAGVPLAAGLAHMIGGSGKTVPGKKEKKPVTTADREALAKAEAKRLRRSSGQNKERVMVYALIATLSVSTVMLGISLLATQKLAAIYRKRVEHLEGQVRFLNLMSARLQRGNANLQAQIDSLRRRCSSLQEIVDEFKEFGNETD